MDDEDQEDDDDDLGKHGGHSRQEREKESEEEKGRTIQVDREDSETFIKVKHVHLHEFIRHLVE